MLYNAHKLTNDWVGSLVQEKFIAITQPNRVMPMSSCAHLLLQKSEVQAMHQPALGIIVYMYPAFELPVDQAKCPARRPLKGLVIMPMQCHAGDCQGIRE